MAEQKQIVIWLTLISAVLYAVLLVAYVIRILKLDKMASNHNLKRPKTLAPKLILIAALILLLVIHVLLSFCDTGYYMHPFEIYSLVDLLIIITLLVQTYIIFAQWRRRARRTPFLLIQWILMALIDLATIIVVEIIQPQVSILLIVFKAIIELVLIVLTIWLQEPAMHRMPKQPHSLLPLMSSLVLQRNVDKIYIQFNKEFEITVKNSQATSIIFKIAVYLGDTSTIINKSQQNFLQLQQDLSKTFPDDQILQNFALQFRKSVSQSTSSSVMKYAEQRQKICQNFLIDLTQNPIFYIETLLDFLEVIKNNQSLLIQKQKNKLMKKQSFTGAQQQRSLFSQPFFKVEWVDNRIHVYNEQILQIIVDKKRQEIFKFHQKLLSIGKLKIQLLSEQPDDNQLMHFIARVTNTKCLWRPFSEWMCLGLKTEEKIYNMFDFWNFGFRNLSISIIGHEIAFDKEGSLHTFYLLSVRKKGSNDSNSKPDGRTLKKRYNEFVKLDKHIRKFFIQNGIKKTPQELPPKFSPFGSKTSPKSRQVYFDNYLKEILRIEKINHCVKFLEFIEADDQFTAQLFLSAEQSFNDDMIANLNSDSQPPSESLS